MKPRRPHLELRLFGRSLKGLHWTEGQAGKVE